MFSPVDRALAREWLIELARSDPRVTGLALVGSAAAGREAEWSDIDLALRLGEDVDATALADDWSASISKQFDVTDQLDVWSDLTLFRVFLLSDTLQIDVSFWPDTRFTASGGAFQIVFGEANPAVADSPFDAGNAIRMGWLYALHVRSSLARGRRWQAIHMINGMRERVLELTCARHGLPGHHGRGLDDLPNTQSRLLGGTLVTSPPDTQLQDVFEQLAEALLAEAQHVDSGLAKRLTDPPTRTDSYQPFTSMRPDRVAMPGQVWGLATNDAAGPVFVTSYDGRDLATTVLPAVDVAGKILWQRRLAGHPRAPRVTPAGTVWRSQRRPTDTLTEVGGDGDVLDRTAGLRRLFNHAIRSGRARGTYLAQSRPDARRPPWHYKRARVAETSCPPRPGSGSSTPTAPFETARR